ncbi:cytochrome c biogenesis protein [Microaerobacter geothermalis]|uniref:cytochrome C assembly family protein n=1 Tax=Microaerobacter geothermalis TaxID=674972 RepID=UPI001F3C786A|nr:cytochrome c biogenesis protein CcsA [Microaerobacter geothermalis]MCF6092667.1 cytochrome c biogenesis protein [Microaerobacter geothermalis]
MLALGWLYDVMIYMYALSVLFYFADFLSSNQRANRVAFWLLAVVWGMQTAFFMFSMLEKDYFPVLTLFETLFFYSWILVTLSLILNYFFKMDLFVFFTNVIGFSVLALNLFASHDTSPVVTEQLTSKLLFIHITMALLSYGAFSLSFIFSMMYLIQNKMLKKKQWTPLLRRLPSLDQLELFSFRLNVIGIPILLLSLILGIIWATVKVPGPFWYDPKVLMSLIVLFAFGFSLYQRITSRWMGKKLALWNIVAFTTVLLNYLVSGLYSSFHLWF